MNLEERNRSLRGCEQSPHTRSMSSDPNLVHRWRERCDWPLDCPTAPPRQTDRPDIIPPSGFMDLALFYFYRV